MMRIGTRRSPLAQAQADRVLALHAGHKVILESDGDHDLISPLHSMQAPGAFTRTLTNAILEGRIEAAVHSLKDLPLATPDAAPITAILQRDDPADVILVRNDAAGNGPLYLRAGSRIGTSAPRRQSQALDADSSLVCIDIRGNIQTRIQLLEHGVVDGLLMAAAAFDRLHIDLPDEVTLHRLDPTRFPGSPGQGVIAVQARADRAQELGHLDHPETRRAVAIERRVLAALGGGCGLPLGCYVARHNSTWHLWATYGYDGGQVRVHVDDDDPEILADLTVTAIAEAQARLAHLPIHSSTGPTVLMTLIQEQLPQYQEALTGYDIKAWPLIETQAVEAPLPQGAAACQWLAVTSPRAARAAADAYACFTNPPRVSAVGAATARALRRAGLPVHAVGKDGTGRGLAEAIARFPREPGPVLVPQAAEPSGGLRKSLERSGFEVLEWPVYRTILIAPSRPDCDVVVLCSASAARAYAAAAYPRGPRLVAFGPTTATAMHAEGLTVDAECSMPGPAGVRDALRVLEATA